MLKMHLILRRRTDSVLELALPVSFRIVFAGITVILVVSMLTLNATSVFAVVIAVITALASLYEERWIFDCESRSTVHNSGFLKLCSRSTIIFDDIESFVLSNYREVPEDSGMLSAKRGVAVRSLVSFQIVTKNGNGRTVEIRSNKQGKSLKEAAETIAEFCGKPLDIR